MSKGYDGDTTTVGGFYVYEIIDPRDGFVFYVGCGAGKRWRSTGSLASARGNDDKYRRLSSILASGRAPTIRIVGRYLSSEDALAIEKEHQIRMFGRATSTARLSDWCGYPNYERRLSYLPRVCLPPPASADAGMVDYSKN